MIKKLFLVLLLLCSPAWAQLDFHETFEGGACVETWASPGCPPTIVNAQTMTGDYYLDLAADDLQLVEDGLVNLGESWFSMQLRIDGDPTANSFFFRAQDSTNTTQCGVFVSSAQLLRFTNSGGTTTNTPHTLSLDTNYTIELRAKKGTGVDTAECAVRVDGGSWTTSTDGDWTANIDQTEIADVSAANFFFDEIKRCNAGAVGDGACDVADTTPPTPGAGVTIAGATPSTLDVSVVAGTDDVTAQANLEYEFRRSLSSNMGSVANAEANGTIVRAYTANDVTHTDTGLTSGVTYYYQVIIKDEAGNKAIHTTAKEAALIIGEAGVTHCRKCGGLYHVPPQTIAEAQEEEAYDGHSLIVLGGAEPRVWTVTGGAIPAGMSLSEAGVLSGTPDAGEAGTHLFKVTVTDANGAKAKGDLAIVVQIAVDSGVFTDVYEDSEDEVLDFVTAGDCSITNTGTLEGSFEITKTGTTDCEVVTGEDLTQVFIGVDLKNAAPTTRQWKTVLGLGTSGAEIFQIIRNPNGGIHAKTLGQTGQEVGGVARGFYLGRPEPITDPDSSAYVELRYIVGTGANATFEARLDGGATQTFSTGTATENFAKLVFRDADDSAGDFVYDRVEIKDDDWPGRGPLVTPPADTTPPTVLSTVPITSATGVALDSDIVVNFSEAMDPATITTGTFTLANGGAVTGTVSYTGTTAIFNPTSSLAATTVYTATITTGAEDIAGNAIAAQYQWTFTTGAAPDTTAPTVSAVTPLDNATGVSINTTLSVTFSEAMDQASITSSSFTLFRGVTQVSGTVSGSGASATFTPTAALSTNTVYVATITTTAQDLAGNNLAGNFTWDFTTSGPPVTPPWITNFVPLRIHYVSTSGSGNGESIGTPESFSQARTHYLCGDLHLYRGGAYTNGGTSALFSRSCTENNPAVFKGYVDAATGQPENAEWKFGVESAGAWNWFVNIHRNNIGVSPTGETGGFLARLAGVRVINSVVHDPPGSNISAFRNSGNPSHPGQVMYGNITYRAGPGTNGAHNYYVQNDHAAQGFKYFVQNISLEPGGNPGGTTGGRRFFQMNDSNGDRGINGIWFEKNFFGDAAVTPDGHNIVWDMSGVSLWQPAFKIIFNDNFFVDFFHSTSLLHSVRTNDGPSLQAEFRRNYFAKANLALDSYWGAQGTRDPWVFRENEIYNPPGGIHLPVFRTYKQSGAAAGAAGSFKIPDADDWDNNTYGGTFVAQLHCNGTNFGNRTLTQWRSDTDGCRVTPASAVGFDINSTNPANPTTDKVVVLLNEYQCSTCVFKDQQRGNIYCANWDNNSTCSADISSVVGPNKSYKIRYPRDFFGTVAFEGICPASGACNVTLPTRRTSGEASGKFANAYVITAQP